ncbi:acyl carrier protein [Methylohalobius crimeensis]|uniref:acyl carrier protein n=1 Tax=Methylohalobius crimeensis TaxID=244365 RepID=UPI0003B3CF4E|nr:acyl carrier protein [Methylohalobius crimeensis]
MMSYQDILAELIATIRALAPGADEVDEHTELVGNLGLDSMKVMNLLQEIEDRFDVSIPLNVLPDVRTVGDLADKIQQLLQDQ